jgi:DNA-binding CsgD family transcriptional regulator
MERVFRAVADSRYYIEDELFSVSERDQLRIFTEVSRPQRSWSNVAMTFAWRGRPLAALRLERVGTSGPRFTREAVAPVLALLPMLSLGWAAVSGQSALPVAAPQTPPLSARERELCRYVARGMHNAEIARLLGTSPNTVRNQLSALFKKVEVTTRTELAIWYEGALAGLDRKEAAEAVGERIVGALTGSAARVLGRRER